MKYFFLFSVFCLYFLAVFPSFAHAYLDPGSGSYLLQTILGVILGGAAGIGLFFGQVKGLIKRIFANNERHQKTE